MGQPRSLVRRATASPFSTPWTDRLRWLRFDDYRMVGMLCLTGLAGLVGFFWGPAIGSDAKDLLKKDLRLYDLRIQGEIVGLSPTLLTKARVTLYFPQMPYQVTRGWQQLEHPKANAFVVPLKFQADCPASLCQLRLQIGDQRLQLGKIQVQPGTQALNFPPATVQL